MFKSVSCQKMSAKRTTARCSSAGKATKRLPDLTEFRKSIHVKGEPLSQTVIRGRG